MGFTKQYKKQHDSEKASNAHAKKIRARGGKVVIKKKGNKKNELVYFFRED